MSNNQDNQNPWNSGNQGPPDLDAVFEKVSRGISRIFSGSKRGDSDNGNSEGSPGSTSVFVVIAAVLVVWLLSGIYIVDEGNRGVVLRFGAYQETTLPGPHWHIPFPIEAAEIVDIDRVRSVQNKARMLTEDENIVEVELAVQYRVKSAADYLFNVRRPDSEDGENPAEGTIFQVMESALREVVGQSKMDFTLGEGRAEIAAKTRTLMGNILDEYRSGLDMISVNLQQSQPPRAVQDAFADAIKAREDEIRFINEAEAYKNGILPKARGEAARMREEALAYRQRVIANAEGEAERFLQLLTEYQKAPVVTRDRLYLQTIESVLSNSSKILLDVSSGNNIFYLPFDKLLEMRDKETGQRRGDLDTRYPSDRKQRDTSAANRNSGRGDDSTRQSPTRRLRPQGMR